ncbi:MAG: cysteine-rich CWC family protein [Deltaproteobacteria bacterium]|nr:MAG: cysteine-rich CWC family protein [Deltaproteobacteria bacterium]
MKEPIDKSTCPICGKPNDCLMARENPPTDEDCWCRFEHFSENLLKRVPSNKRGRVCVCRDCVRKYQ